MNVRRRNAGLAGSYRYGMSAYAAQKSVQFVGLLARTFSFRNAVTSPSQEKLPMTCFRRKGNNFVHTAPRIRSAVSRIHTGFPCSANKNACPLISRRVAHLPQNKPGFMITPSVFGGVLISSMPPIGQSVALMWGKAV